MRASWRDEGALEFTFDLLYRSSHLMTSSADTLRLDKSMYPGERAKMSACSSRHARRRELTLLLVHSQYDDYLIPPYSDQLLDRSNAPPRQL